MANINFVGTEALESSFHEMIQGFSNKVRDLKALMMLKTPESFAEYKGDLESAHQRIKDLEQIMAKLKIQIESEKKYVQQAADLKMMIRQQNEDLQYMQNNLPAKLPGNNITLLPQHTPSHKEIRTESKSLPSSVNNENEAPSNVQNVLPPTQKKLSTANLRISYVTISELDSIPKYMKGRLTIDKVNNAIDELFPILEEKYKILSTSMNKLHGESLKKYKEFRDQETPDTKNLRFFVEQDLKNASALKLDATGKCILQILLHLNRIRSLPGSLRRYVINS